jgi:hypothetical protein
MSSDVLRLTHGDIPLLKTHPCAKIKGHDEPVPFKSIIKSGVAFAQYPVGISELVRSCRYTPNMPIYIPAFIPCRDETPHEYLGYKFNKVGHAGSGYYLIMQDINTNNFNLAAKSLDGACAFTKTVSEKTYKLNVITSTPATTLSSSSGAASSSASSSVSSSSTTTTTSTTSATSGAGGTVSTSTTTTTSTTSATSGVGGTVSTSTTTTTRATSATSGVGGTGDTSTTSETSAAGAPVDAP